MNGIYKFWGHARYNIKHEPASKSQVDRTTDGKIADSSMKKAIGQSNVCIPNRTRNSVIDKILTTYTLNMIQIYYQFIS